MIRSLSTLLTLFIAFNAAIHAEEPANAVKESSQNAGESPDKITRHEFKDPATGAATAYLLYHPANPTPPDGRSLLIYLYGAGGSLEFYNFSRPPYAALRTQLAERGFYVVVPDLGKGHFMNDAAKATLDGMVDQILAQEQIPSKHVHIMGTSMGGGSSLAYAIHRPKLIRSVCAVMPMTDFAQWIVERPDYEPLVSGAYGGTYQQVPEAYDRNSAIKNADAFAKIPVMLVHGNTDTVVAYEQSKRLAELLQAKKYPCEFYTAENMAHDDEAMANFQTQAMAFFERANR